MRELEPCRTYVDHLRAEHRQLHSEVRRIQSALEAASASRTASPELKAELTALGEELQRHFAEEEEGGCLEEAISRCPGVAPEADAVGREHAGLLATLRQIIAHLPPAPAGEPLKKTQQEFNRFAGQLCDHEAAENRIMQRAFGVMVNGEDDE